MQCEREGRGGEERRRVYPAMHVAGSNNLATDPIRGDSGASPCH